MTLAFLLSAANAIVNSTEIEKLLHGKWVSADDDADRTVEFEASRIVLTVAKKSSGDGQPKVFRNSAVENLNEFFERFRYSNIGSHHQLNGLVNQASGLCGASSRTN